MKKRIAVLGNGWSVEYINLVLKGIRRGAEEYGADIFFFMNYSVNDDTYEHSVGEANIYTLTSKVKFDGVILLLNSFHLQEEFDFVKEHYIDCDIPVISLEYQLLGIPFIGTDNYSGMRQICEHVVDVHKSKKIMFISGPVEHEENMIRRKALEDVLQERSLTLDEENVIVCNWNLADVEQNLPNWLQTHSYLPDAIICANDMMAMGTCNVLGKAGYRVPQDVIVTGFDHLLTAEAYSPSITTVDRNWDSLGYSAVESLFGKMAGIDIPDVRYIKMKAIPNESCGCKSMEISEDELIRERRNSYNNYLSRANIGLYVCALADTISKAVSEKDLCDILRNAPWNEIYEGDEFYFCMVDNFFTSLLGGEGLTFKGYTDKIRIIYGQKNNKYVEQTMMDLTEIVPQYNPNAKESKCYLMLPLYGEDGFYGYMTFGNELEIIYDYSLYSWMRHMNMSLRHVRRGIVMNEMNAKLEMLSNTDALTGVYNRFGCDNLAYPFLEKCYNQGKTASLIFADINKMKYINDNFGHVQGDFAIKTVANAIKEILQDDWIIVRYGGDEFLLVGEFESDNKIKQIYESISDVLVRKVKEQQIPYDITVSMGHVIVNPEENFNMSEYLTRAENLMYIMKKKLHEAEKTKETQTEN